MKKKRTGIQITLEWNVKKEDDEQGSRVSIFTTVSPVLSAWTAENEVRSCNAIT